MSIVDKIIVAGSLGAFLQGQELTDRTKIAEYYREAMNEGLDEDEYFTKESYTDERLLSHLDSIDVTEAGDDVDEIDRIRCERLLELAMTNDANKEAAA